MVASTSETNICDVADAKSEVDSEGYDTSEISYAYKWNHSWNLEIIAEITVFSPYTNYFICILPPTLKVAVYRYAFNDIHSCG